MKEIGGFFEWELPKTNGKFLHSENILLNSGRHALEYILLSNRERVKKVWLPSYTCNSLLQPLNRLKIDFETYDINLNLEIDDIPPLQEQDFIIVNNYFGIKDPYVNQLVSLFKDKIIIDQTQAWYAQEIPGIKAFYSPRKYFGIPDGGIACGVLNSLSDTLPRDISQERCRHLLKRLDTSASDGYEDFKQSSLMLCEAPLLKMSNLTKSLLESIDMPRVKDIRKDNFQHLHSALSHINSFSIPEKESFECPMVYPLITDIPGLRQRLINRKIYVATYWPHILALSPRLSPASYLAANLIPLPIDQRYGPDEMNFIIQTILEK